MNFAGATLGGVAPASPYPSGSIRGAGRVNFFSMIMKPMARSWSCRVLWGLWAWGRNE